MSNSKQDFDIAELKVVLEEAYAIGKIEQIEPISCDEEELLRAAGSLDNGSNSAEELNFGSSFRVSTDQGEYFLKRIGDWIEEDRLTAIEEFIRWTDERNYALSPSIKVSRSGQTHIAMSGNRFQLFDFIAQQKRQIWMRSKLSQNDCALAGNLLARMHLASAEYLGEKPERKESFSMPCDWPATCEAFFQRIKGEKAVLYPALLNVAKNEDYLKARFFSAIQMVNNYSKCVVPMLVHGDVHPGNVLFFKNETGSRSARLVDFDYLRKDHPLHDVGYALIMFARSRFLRKSKRSTRTSIHRLDLKLGKAFLCGYFQALRLNPAEIDEFKIRKSEVMAGCLNPRWLFQYTTFACFLIMDWAVEKLINGPVIFSGVYADVIEMIESLVCYDVGEKVQNICIEALLE